MKPTGAELALHDERDAADDTLAVDELRDLGQVLGLSEPSLFSHWLFWPDSVCPGW